MKKIKNSLTIVPFFFTFSNAILGLLSVFKALDSEFIAAAYCILLAAFMDGLDGRLARALGSSSLLGMELDSLSDAISFCVAPVVLLYTWEVQDFGTLGFIVLSIYLCSGLFRLAKFNITSVSQSNFFMGLPTPIAAFFLTSLVLYQESRVADFLLQKYILFSLLIFISFLMISKIKFPSFKQQNPKLVLFVFSVIILLCLAKGYPWALLVPVFYISSACMSRCYVSARRFLISRS